MEDYITVFIIDRYSTIFEEIKAFERTVLNLHVYNRQVYSIVSNE